MRFVGQHTQLNQLKNTLFIKNQPPKLAVYGLGGVGKTQIALELAYQTREKYPECSVFWIPATNAESLQQAFTNISQQLGMPGVEDEQADAKKLVQRYLGQDSAGQWLLVIDNVDDMDIWNNELKSYLPRSHQGCVVCTTRSRKVAVKIAAVNVIEVLKMNQEMAMQLLGRSLINQTLLSRHKDALELLKQLTFLPLAIVQAAAYINANGIALSDYLSLLDEQEEDVIDLLSEDFEDDGRYQDVKNPVATTWLISFDQIQRLDPLAAEYLSFMSCVNPRDIPQSLLPLAQSKEKKEKAIGTLDAYSFISRRSDNALDVHQLVHLVTRSWLRAQNQWHSWANRTLERLVEVVPFGDHDKIEVWTAYLPHAIHVVNLAELCEGEGRMRLLDRVGRCEWTLGRYKAAEWAYKQLFEKREKVLGKEHPETLDSMNELGVVLNSQGKYVEAEKMHREALRQIEKVSGKDSLGMSISMNNLALVLRNLGRYTEGENMHRKVLKIEERLGMKDVSTLYSMSNLAQVLRDQERYAESETMHQETLELRNKVLGKEHPDTLASMNDVALVLGDLGRYAEAEEMHWKALEIKRRVFGKKHPSTLTSLHNLALSLDIQKKFVGAEWIYQKTLTLRVKVLGKEHPDTLITMNNLAFTLKGQNRNQGAILLMQQCFKLREQILGPQHPYTVESFLALNGWRTELMAIGL